MNKKELILKLRENFNKKQNSSKKLVQESKKFFSKTDTNSKQLEFLKWCKENIPDYKELDIKKIIDKIAIWYEFRYPEQFIDTLFYYNKIINSNKEPNFQELKDLVNWKDLFNYDTFMITLTKNEKEILQDVRFNEIYKLEKDGTVYFNQDGSIINIETLLVNDDFFNFNEILNSYIGKNVNELVCILMEYGRFFDAIDIYDLCILYNNKLLFKVKLLEMVLDKIIKRRGIELGFLFILEFNLDINLLSNYISNNDLSQMFIHKYLNLLNKEEYNYKDLKMNEEEQKFHEYIIKLLNLKKIFRTEKLNLNEEINQKLLKKII